ncbi:paramyosin-like [Papaver somniferum]|uniref:paramyosin-like n=1 Tax=Papaver somniferum TaxID=3469 RepID=UPI000E7030C7|nr:paramyosin-like [Papaver somniferum]
MEPQVVEVGSDMHCSWLDWWNSLAFACASFHEDIALVEKRLSAQEIIRKKYHVDFEADCASLVKVTAERNVLPSETVYQALSSENASLRINVDDLRRDRDNLVEDLDASKVDLAEAQHSLEESLSHAEGLQEKLVGANAKINCLEVEKRLSAQEIIRKKYHVDFEAACASLVKVTAERNVLPSENASLRINVDDLRRDRDNLVEDLDASKVDLAEAQHSLEESLSHAEGLQEQLVGANAKINLLEGQISQLEISGQFDATVKFKAEAFQQANDQLSAQIRELRQESASDLAAQVSQMEAQFKRSVIDYINNAFAEAELQAKVEKRLSAQEIIRKKYHVDFEAACASLVKVTAERNVLPSENASLRINVDDLRRDRDNLVEDLDASKVDLAEAQHSLEESLSHAEGLQEKLVGANAKINCLEGKISQLEISGQFDATVKFKAEAFQQANDQLSAQIRELRQESASDLAAQVSQMEAQFKRSVIDYINNAFAEAELQAKVEKRLSAQEIIRKKYHVDFEAACASLVKVTAERNVLPSENASLRINVDDLRRDRDNLVEDLDASKVDLAEAQHSLEESLSHAEGLQEQLVGANAKINLLEGQISQLEISGQFDATVKFKAEAFQQANDQLSAQIRELRQESASDLAAQVSQMEAQFKRSVIDYINNAFAEAELQAKVEKRLSAQEIIRKKYHVDFEAACASLVKVTAERNVLPSENASLRINVDDLRRDRDNLVEDLDASKVDLAEAQHSLEESLSHAEGLQEQLVGANAKINRLEGQISQLEISR